MELLSQSSKLIFSIGSLLLYSVGWLVGMFCLSHQEHFFAYAYILFIFCPFLFIEKNYRPIESATNRLLILWALPLGFFLELSLILSGSIIYQGSFWLPPFSILMLYPLFSVLITYSFRWLRTRLWLASILGFFGGPLIYLQGVYLGAAEFSPSWSAHILVAFLWAALFPTLVALSNRFEKKIEALLKNAREESLTLLVDKKCPLCAREVSHLEKKNGSYHTKKVLFVDLNSLNYRPENFRNITVEIGMKKIHAITAKGEILTGIDAFIPAYARTGHLFLALLYSQPLSRTLCYYAYQIFARNRKFMVG